MSPTPQRTEKRKFARYITRPEIFAALGKKFSRVGRVKDVSLGGVAFEYITDEHNENDLTLIDIFATGNGLHLSRIPCRKIYEVSVKDTTEVSSFSSELKTKRCGVEFDSLTDEQTSQVKHLIERYTDSKVQR